MQIKELPIINMISMVILFQNISMEDLNIASTMQTDKVGNAKSI
jgi:hypothetical protein